MSSTASHMASGWARLLAVFAIGTASLFSVRDSHGQARTLHVDTNAEGAAVYADGNWLGRAVDSPLVLPASAKEIRVLSAGLDVWSVDPLVFDLRDNDNPVVHLDAHFPNTYRFESNPSGAQVFLGDQLLGQTPLRLIREQPLEGNVAFVLPGYTSRDIPAGSEIWNFHRVTLTALETHEEAVSSGFVVQRARRDWISIAASTTAFAAGALAIHYRTKADNRFDDFNATGKPGLKSDVKRLDVQSGIALGVMQVGIGVVAIRLAF